MKYIRKLEDTNKDCPADENAKDKVMKECNYLRKRLSKRS